MLKDHSLENLALLTSQTVSSVSNVDKEIAQQDLLAAMIELNWSTSNNHIVKTVNQYMDWLTAEGQVVYPNQDASAFHKMKLNEFYLLEN